MPSQSENGPSLPREPIHRITEPLAHFLHIEAAGGLLLLGCALLALACANSPWADVYLSIWKTPMGLEIGDFRLVHSLKHWINDGLMAVFFFVIGLEVKRELVLGELREVRKAALPVAGALGGMLVPACVYLALQRGAPGEAGWGIPMATDIAFVVGCLALLGPRVPHGLRITLLSLAIVDDIGAILVIAIGYTADVDLAALGLGLLGIGLVLAAQRAGIRSFGLYTLLGFGVWLAFHESGVHATIAGVAIGLLTPAHPRVSQSLFRSFLDRTLEAKEAGAWALSEGRAERLARLRRAALETVSPLEFVEHRLHPWVGFGIMPIFALANAGVPFSLGDVGEPVARAVEAGLVLGKPLGVLIFVFAAVRLGVADLPAGVGWGAILGGGVLSGIGFTMALFIAGLALDGQALTEAKVGVLAASAVAALLGLTILRLSLPEPADDA